MDRKFKIKAVCHKGGIGNYKLIPEEPIEFDFDKIMQKEGLDEVKKPTDLILIIRKGDVTMVFSKRKGTIMVENVVPDTPERAMELVNEILD
ncbi:MAG TPA: hypothetical protein ENF18_06795 [candidate division WOR-3 bacterium]|uniref:Uncharacterized protein n=1 Tax=candidate division WOR-3 bacterium TaxID=2052148 RepID=A0A7C0ZAD9_UNCW3|nr:hypothetical protein [candidate division WOR-3 bacterium]